MTASATFAELTRLPSDSKPAAVVEALDRDGALIIEHYADMATIERIRDELAPHLDGSPNGKDGFLGHNTTRVGAIMARSPSSHALALDPMLNEACGAFLAPHADGFQLHLTQMVSIGPGEGMQPMHRDRAVWGGHVPRSIETQFSTIWALTDFTEASGATRVVPGSHRWDDERRPQPEEITVAEMDATSVLVYSGSVLHGGGRNDTDLPREGLLLHNTLDWLRQEENQYLSCPPHIARDFSPELRALLGYQSCYSMGFFSHSPEPDRNIELVSPAALFRHPAPNWPGMANE
jgi:hypothetical protein